jgi:uncharacterized protein (DUF433 family)
LEIGTLQRDTVSPPVMGDEPGIRGLRAAFGILLESAAAGLTEAGLLQGFPYRAEPDIRNALSFSASHLQRREVKLAIGKSPAATASA